ncbi:hypothetical protein X777_02792 [Ooceraea biroi]|uniref:Uncharacterized protein n=1 Tax=Ooceraea biroi TaxID=2015173 RepID=A0A026WMQ8_OOCBI|nr:hypothetical protein X777_02792 [Ooceraea biroi]
MLAAFTSHALSSIRTCFTSWRHEPTKCVFPLHNLFFKIPSTVKAKGVRAASFCGGLSERFLRADPFEARC